VPTDTGRDRQDVDAGSYVAPGYSIDNYYCDMEGEVMPRRPAKPCAQVGCPNKALPGKSRCEQHQAEAELRQQAAKREHDKRRGNFRERGYTSQYDKAKAMKQKRDPLCERCLEEGKVKPMQIVHHIKPIKEGGELLALDNMMSVCRECHKELHK